MEVCLVLSQDVNFFHYSRKQRFPCWRSPSFLFLSWRNKGLKDTLLTLLRVSRSLRYGGMSLTSRCPQQTKLSGQSGKINLVMSDKVNPWVQKSNTKTDLLNIVTFDIYPTN